MLCSKQGTHRMCTCFMGDRESEVPLQVALDAVMGAYDARYGECDSRTIGAGSVRLTGKTAWERGTARVSHGTNKGMSSTGAGLTQACDCHFLRNSFYYY